MSSENVGLGARITAINPKSKYIHCMSHRLNLSIAVAGACKNLTIISVIDNITPILAPPQKEVLLNHFFEQETHPGRKNVLLSLCKTRWSERDGAYEHFYLAIPFIHVGGDIKNNIAD